MMTAAPRSAMLIAVARPMPDVAPVTRIVLRNFPKTEKPRSHHGPGFSRDEPRRDAKTRVRHVGENSRSVREKKLRPFLAAATRLQRPNSNATGEQPPKEHSIERLNDDQRRLIG